MAPGALETKADKEATLKTEKTVRDPAKEKKASSKDGSKASSKDKVKSKGGDGKEGKPDKPDKKAKAEGKPDKPEKKHDKPEKKARLRLPRVAPATASLRGPRACSCLLLARLLPVSALCVRP
jgi:hypothetical protein